MKRSTRTVAVFGVLVAAAAVAWYLNGAQRWPELRADLGARPAADASQPGKERGSSGADGADGGVASQPKAATGGRRRGEGGPVPVTTIVLEPRTVPIQLRVVGRAEAYSTVSLRSRIDGQILSVDFQPGETVRRGQTMVFLDDRLPKAQADQARANLARDQANLKKAIADLRRTEDLVARGFVSSAQVDAARAAMASLEATVNADRAAIEMATTQLSYTRIAAPIDGVAGSVLVFPGNIVRANDTPLVVINQTRPINVAFSVPEGRLPEIRAADEQAGKALPVTARVPGDEREPLEGRLTFVDNAVDPTTGTIVLKARFENESRRLTPGQFVEVDLLLRQVRDAIVIPSEALQNGPQGTFVYVAKGDGTVEIRPVQASPGEGPTLIVTSGLRAGERIVVDGQLRLTPGARYSEAGAAPGNGNGNGSGNGTGNGRRPADPS